MSSVVARIGVGVVLTLSLVIGACRRGAAPEPAVATPTVTLNHDRAPAGSPIEITYKFVVASGAAFDRNYRVMVHIVDTDEELMWTDDHEPPVPTSQWKPGQTIEYTRTVFVPVFPYVGEAGILIGLYSVADQKRLPLDGQDMGQRAYKVGTLGLQPQTENLFTVFKDGWHPAEVAGKNSTDEWQWTKREASLAFKNPKKDALLYLDLDSPSPALHGAQQIRVSMGGQALEEFALQPTERLLRKIPLPATRLGEGEMAEVQIAVDATFVPALVTGAQSDDKRELGVRVFHAFVDAR